MASGMVHSVIDLLAFGRHHFDLHQKKDEPARTLGICHREMDHEWYNAFGVEWDFNEPFPVSLHRAIDYAARAKGDEEAERMMSFAAHDYLDRVWDSLSPDRREYTEAFCMWVLFHPDVLKEDFGVDVYDEKIARTLNGVKVWDNAPGLNKEYRRLLAYAKRVLENRAVLQRLLHRFGSVSQPSKAGHQGAAPPACRKDELR